MHGLDWNNEKELWVVAIVCNIFLDSLMSSPDTGEIKSSIYDNKTMLST